MAGRITFTYEELARITDNIKRPLRPHYGGPTWETEKTTTPPSTPWSCATLEPVPPVSESTTTKPSANYPAVKSPATKRIKKPVRKSFKLPLPRSHATVIIQQSANSVPQPITVTPPCSPQWPEGSQLGNACALVGIGADDWKWIAKSHSPTSVAAKQHVFKIMHSWGMGVSKIAACAGLNTSSILYHLRRCPHLRDLTLTSEIEAVELGERKEG